MPTLHVRIHDKIYDCTSFQERHPGGNVISHYHGVDATDAFEAFHGDSAWAKRLLRALPELKKGDQEAADAMIAKNSENMTRFHQKIQKEFYGRPREMLLFALWALVVVGCILLACYLAKECRAPLSAGLIIGVAWAHCGFLQHHAGHVAVTGRRSIDFILQTVFEGLCKGGSARWWRSRHNKHHACPNMIGVDGGRREELENAIVCPSDEK